MAEKRQLLTHSRVRSFLTCPRKHHHAYNLGIRPIEKSPALRFGTLIHQGLEAWWFWSADMPGHAEDRMLDSAEPDDQVDPYERERILCLLQGYHLRYQGTVGGASSNAPFELTAVEKEFEAPLRNPDGGRPSRVWRLAGKIDAIAISNEQARGRVIIEHKTTSADIGPESSYWRTLSIDGQVSQYLLAMSEERTPASGVVYDVLRKPQIRPRLATPPEKQKRKADGSLYANQRAKDEDPAEYRARIMADIASDPSRYYRRSFVIRFEDELAQHQRDLWMISKTIRAAQLADAHPRNPGACHQYGSVCAYFDVCTGTDRIDNPERFEQTSTHPELEGTINGKTSD